MNDFALAIIWLTLFAAVFFSWYFFLQARTKERTLLIDKGADASNFYAKKPERKGFRFPWLKFGLLAVGIAFGLMFGFVMTHAIFPSSLGRIDEPFVFGSTILFGGLGMILAHFTDQKKNQ
ncbi:hypothetical protein J1N10_05285 [Carboxylicivirga sp. A043]|uniref:DUF6249 domain-containing protein n=1 Tax=Carboxylicivirga litoralis TaxID=2816963 RepID=UPI0021CB683D|nr:DUF6249 domain-containing protein [Carboxylicivirga sp. A043]MCU4155378.1 hypothetical protein [Carboxylicivirga sp. A043]